MHFLFKQTYIQIINIFHYLNLFVYSESESELLLVTRTNDNHSPGPVIREFSPQALIIREVNLATESSAPSAAERRESVSEFQSLIVWGKKLLF